MKKNRIYHIILIITACIVLPKYLIHICEIDPNCLPVWSDEYFYYLNTQAFYENNTLEASFTYNGEGAVVGGADAHGFMYPLFHGTLAKVFGWNNLNMVITNLCLLFLAAVSIFYYKFLARLEQILFALLVLAYPFGFLYGFSYMQESIQLFFAVLAGIQLFLVYTKDKNKINQVLFLIILVIASLFRPTWLFASIALIPKTRSVKGFIAFSGIFLFCAFSSFIYAKYCFEFVPNFFNNALAVWQNQGIGSFLMLLWSHFIENIRLLFSFGEDITYFFMKMSIVGLALAFSILFFIKKDRLYLALALVYMVNILCLLVLYDAHSWREIRFLSPLFYFSLIALIKKVDKKYTTGMLLVLMSMLFCAPIQLFVEGRNSFSKEELRVAQTKFNELFNSREAAATMIRIDFPPSDYSLDLLSLPVQNKKGKQLKYMAPHYNTKKKKPDYLLTGDRQLIPFREEK